jgi:thymidylate kinase
MPQRTYFFAIRPQEVSEREGFGTERYEAISFQERVYSAYQDLIKTPSQDPQLATTWKVRNSCYRSVYLIACRL